MVVFSEAPEGQERGWDIIFRQADISCNNPINIT